MNVTQCIAATLVFLFCLVANSFAQQNQPTLVLQNGHTAKITTIAISPDGKIIASAGQDARLIFWDAQTGRLLRALAIGSRQDLIGVRFADTARALAFSPDGKILAALQQGALLPSGKILFYEVETGRMVREVPFASYDEFYSDIAFSPDGKTFAVARTRVDDAKKPKLTPEIQIWNAATGKKLFTLEGHAKAINSIAFSPDGKILASGSDDATIKLWDARTRKEIRALKSHTGGVTVVAFSRDGKFFAGLSAKLEKQGMVEIHGASEGIKIWDAQTWREIRTLKNESNREASFVFNPDGKTLVSVSRTDSSIDIDGETTLWDFRTGEKIESPGFIDEEKNDVYKFGEVIYVLPSYSSPSIVFNANGAIAASVGDANSIYLWEMNPKRVHQFRGNTLHAIDKLAFNADGRTLAATEDLSYLTVKSDTDASLGEVFLWSLDAETDARLLTTHIRKADEYADESDDVRDSFFSAPTISPDGKLFAAVTDEIESSEKVNFKIKLYDVGSGAPLRTLGTPLSDTAAIAFSADMKRLACLSIRAEKAKDGFSSRVQVWEITTGRELQTINDLSDFAPRGLARQIAFSPDLDRLIVSNHKIITGKIEKRPARVYDLNTGKEIRRIENFNDPFAFSPDGKMLIGVSDARDEVHLYDATSYTKLQTVNLTTKQKSSNLIAFVFSRDGKMFASVKSSDTSQIWETQSGREVAQLKLTDKNITSLAFTPNGKFIFTGHDDTTLSLWNAASGERLADLISLETVQKKTSDEAEKNKARERDWLVVTPEGLFDGMPASWNQLLWRFSPRISDVAPVENYFKESYYPGLLNELLSGKRPKPAQSITQIDRRTPQIILSVSLAEDKANKTLATTDPTKQKYDPEKKYDEPSSNTGIVVEGLVKVQIEISNAQAGARDVRLFRNGSLVKVWRGDVKFNDAGKAVLETNVRLLVGSTSVDAVENQLTVSAFNRNDVKSADVSLSVKGYDESEKHPSTLYVIAVGVNVYENPQFNLRYAVADAEDFGAELEAQQKTLDSFARVVVVPLADKDATKANILLALKLLAAKEDESKTDFEPPSDAPESLKNLEPAAPEDAVIFYYAGHGTAAGRAFYLIPHDLGYTGARRSINKASLQTILSHSISDVELEHAFASIDAGQFVLIIDACESGQVLESEEKRRAPLNTKGLAQLAYEKGMYVLTAAESFQAAQELTELGHGLLTYTLVEEGLKKRMADAKPKDGKILLREWLDYATARVPQLQLEKMREAKRTRGFNISVVEGDEKIADPDGRRLQRPRVFYRRELEARPLIVAQSAEP